MENVIDVVISSGVVHVLVNLEKEIGKMESVLSVITSAEVVFGLKIYKLISFNFIL